MNLNKEWCDTEYSGPNLHKWEYSSQNEFYATYQILIAGHKLYSRNPEFRELFLETFNSELILPTKNLIEFLYGTNFSVIYFGLLASDYLIKQGPCPEVYIEQCSPENSTELSKFVASETMRLKRPVNMKPGMPGYYYRESRTKVFNNSLTGEAVKICPIKSLLEIAINFAKQFQTDAKKFVNENYEDENLKQMLVIIRDKSWSFIIG